MLPRLKRFSEERGVQLHSKQIEIDGLAKAWPIELYRFIVEHPGTGVDMALAQLFEQGKSLAGGGDRTIPYRAVRRLKRLMEPVD